MVLGDTQSGGRRKKKTTRATQLLRQVKQEFKAAYAGQPKTKWIPLARRAFAERVKQAFAKQGATINDVGLVLICCTDKALQSGRVAQPFTHAYAGDTGQPRYGIAQCPTALDFFLASRDAPTLSHALQTHAKNIAALQRRYASAAPQLLMQDFVTTVQYFQSKQTQAAQGHVLAQQLLEDLCPLTALKEQWNVSQQQLAAMPAADGDDSMMAGICNTLGNDCDWQSCLDQDTTMEMQPNGDHDEGKMAIMSPNDVGTAATTTTTTTTIPHQDFDDSSNVNSSPT